MWKAIAAAIITLVVAIFSEAALRDQFNLPGIGIMFAVSVMGACIIYFNETKK